MTGNSPLVIFDCDGVLVDSEPISNRVFCEMLNELGLPLTVQQVFDRFVGLSMPQCVAGVAELLGASPPPDFVARLQARTEAALRSGVKPMPGIREVLDTLCHPYCVASSGPHSKIRTTLGTTGLVERFDGRIFSAQDVRHSKPAPDLFLHAAAMLGHAPSRCLVVEDTPTGVRAGVAAGMRVFGFCAFTPVDRLVDAGAHATFSAMHELPAMIEGWAGR